MTHETSGCYWDIEAALGCFRRNDMTSKSNITDMTEGSTVKLLVRFAVPLFIGNLFQQFYNMVDSIVVGRVLGANALAAVGSCGSLCWLFFSFAGGMAVGIGIIVAQYFGAGDEEKIRATIGSAVYVLAGISLILSSLGFILAPYILRFMKTPDTVIGNAQIYLRTMCVGMVCIAAYEGVAAILRALGDSRTPLYFLISASIVNTVLDILFVKYMGMGVFGAAFASIISQFLAALGAFLYASRRIPYFKLSREERKPNREIIKNAVRLGTPIALQNSLIAISCVILQNVVNTFGETVMATYAIEMKLESLIQQPYSSMSASITTYTGQNIGAGNIERVKKGFRKGILINFLFSMAVSPLFFFFGKYAIAIFVNDAAVIEMGAKALKIVSLCYFPLGCIYVPRAVMNGAGDARFSMINGLTEVVCRITYSIVLTGIASIGFWGIWITSGATWTTVAVVCLLRYYSGVWMKKAVVHTASAAAHA
jgi:putative MATE family efflux protein